MPPEAADAALLRVPSTFPDGVTGSIVENISADGRTVVGELYESIDPAQPAQGDRMRAFRWTIEDGPVRLDVPAGIENTRAYAVNADGSVIVGQTVTSEAIFRAVVWRSGVLQELEVLEQAIDTTASAVSDDGGVIVGYQMFAGGVKVPVRWTAAGVEALESPSDTLAADVSGNGAMVAGASSSRALRWSSPGSLDEMSMPNALLHRASAISQDGSVSVGTVQLAEDHWEAFRWQGSNVELLGTSPSAFDRPGALGVDADGSTIVGWGFNEAAWVWDSAHGTRNLSTILSGLGQDISNLSLQHATAVSADGRHIAVRGLCAEETPLGFLVRLPAKASELGDGSGAGAP